MTELVINKENAKEVFETLKNKPVKTRQDIADMQRALAILGSSWAMDIP
jgi:hypothetical protein